MRGLTTVMAGYPRDDPIPHRAETGDSRRDGAHREISANSIRTDQRPAER